MPTTPAVFQRETDDWTHIAVTQQGAAYDDAWSYQIVPRLPRPTGTWTAAIANLTGQKGINIVGLTAGYYWVFIRIDGQDGYIPILDPIDLIIS